MLEKHLKGLYSLLASYSRVILLCVDNIPLVENMAMNSEGAFYAEANISVRVTSMGQIELFNHLLRIIISYLKPYRCVQIVYIR